jgi:hypothetical protein
MLNSVVESLKNTLIFHKTFSICPSKIYFKAPKEYV